MRTMGRARFVELVDKIGGREEVARRLDVTRRQMRRYVSGETPIPRTVELSLAFLAYCHSPRVDSGVKA